MSILPIRTNQETIDLYTDVIVGARRRIKKITLHCGPARGGDALARESSRLLLAINPVYKLRTMQPRSVHRFRYGGNTFWFHFPKWMDVQLNPDSWRSQSRSGALYLSRTDLGGHFSVAGVLLLQILMAGEGSPCLTSWHEHRHTRELFDPLDAAGATEYRRGALGWRVLKERLEIPPGEPHQLRRVAPGPSVNLIQMYGACKTEQGRFGPLLDMTDHIYLRSADVTCPD